MSARVVVDGRVTLTNLSRDTELDIVRLCTHANPAHARQERMGLSTHDTDATITTWDRVPGGVSIPRGVLPHVLRMLRDAGVPYAIIDQTIAPSLDMPSTIVGALRPYQQTALEGLLGRRSGVCVAPTGSGKTNILLSAIPRLQARTLILVHTRELLRQTVARCESWLGVTPGIIGGGRWDVQPVTVATIQTLARRGVSAIADQFGAVLVDECHHAPARTWAGLLDELPARYRYGFSATPWRKDGLGFLLGEAIGPVTARVTAAEVQATGATVTPTIETVETGYYYDLDDPSDWTRMLTDLCSDDTRNRVVADAVRARLTPETRALVLTDRVEHAHTLAALLEDLQPVVLTGDMRRAEREAAMAAVRAGTRVTVATAGLLGEGVDVPGWSLLALATPMAGGPRTLQAIGRVTRAAPGKATAVVVDIVDPLVPALVGAHRQRVRLYREVA